MQESDDDEVDGVSDPIGAGTLGVGGGGAKGEGGHTAMVADILKEKEKAEEMKAKEADAEAKVYVGEGNNCCPGGIQTRSNDFHLNHPPPTATLSRSRGMSSMFCVSRT